MRIATFLLIASSLIALPSAENIQRYAVLLEDAGGFAEGSGLVLPIRRRAGRELEQVIRKGPTFLYVEVENLDETIAAVKGAEVVMPRRTTFYGSTEIGIKDPAGHFITFAQFGSAQK